MTGKHPLRLYNIMFPVWLLVWWPSWLWLGLIPLNYAVDRLVLAKTLPDGFARGPFCRRHSWKLCLAGFAADLAGSLLLLGAYVLGDRLGPAGNAFANTLAFYPWRSAGAVLLTALAVAAAAVLIFLLDRALLKKAGLSPGQAARCAKWLAAVTAPYLFFFPSGLLYR